MSDTYILEGHTPVPCDTMTWARWFEANREARKVAREARGDISVSTVFLGLDHQYVEGGPPLIFETMIFGGEHDEDQDRCSTWEEAEAMHARMCARAFGTPP